MKLYAKPVVVLNEELAEGVYAASGDVATDEPTVSNGVFVSSVEIVNHDTWNKNIQYKVVLKNTSGEEKKEWSVALHVTGTATGLTSYDPNFIAALNGSTITITPGTWGQIPAGGSKEVQFTVSYSGDSISIG